MGLRRFLTAFFPKVQTFSRNSSGKLWETGCDITWQQPGSGRIMQTGGGGFPQGAGDWQRAEIPVENYQFSTFSTEFSTRVFHRRESLWKPLGDWHKKNRRPSTAFLLFRTLWFLPQGSFCAGFWDLTGSAVERQPGPGPRKKRKFFWKGGWFCLKRTL